MILLNSNVRMFSPPRCLFCQGGRSRLMEVVDGLRRIECSGGVRHITNNRMEVMAAIVGLETLQVQSKVKIYTASKYVQEGIGRGWARNWRASGWRIKKGKRINSDLWGRLLKLY